MVILKTHQLFLVLVVSILIVGSCKSPDSKNAQPSELALVDGCVSAPESFAYSVSPDPNKPQYPGNGLTVLPSSPWQAQSSLPYKSADLAIRSVQGSTEIWVKRNPYNPSGSKIHEFMIYYPETKVWESVSAEVATSGGYAGKLFVTKDGALWGQNFWDASQDTTGQSIITGQPILSKYNEKTKQFEFEDGTRQFSHVWMDPSKVPYGSEILLDFRGIFWIFVHKDAIYSYNPATKETKRHINIPDQIVSKPELALDGSIYYTYLYYLEHGMTLTISDIKIFHFFPETGKLEEILIPLEPWPTFSNILVDRRGRLWLDSLGWREPDGKWYQIHRSPLFITNVLWSGVEHRWKTPHILMESSNGLLWFQSDNGLTWLDPQKGEWCWFTTEQSNIVEDKLHNLWMIADNKLYQLNLEP